MPVARNKQKMDQIAAEVKKSFGITTRVITKDLSLPESATKIF
jgi:short-subunit dehydrogenase